MDPGVLLVLLVTTGVAYLMVAAGVSKHALQWKRRGAICPSCGRERRDCSCCG
jgi:hypothetical protein